MVYIYYFVYDLPCLTLGGCCFGIRRSSVLFFFFFDKYKIIFKFAYKFGILRTRYAVFTIFLNTRFAWIRYTEVTNCFFYYIFDFPCSWITHVCEDSCLNKVRIIHLNVIICISLYWLLICVLKLSIYFDYLHLNFKPWLKLKILWINSGFILN